MYFFIIVYIIDGRYYYFFQMINKLETKIFKNIIQELKLNFFKVKVRGLKI